MNLIRIIPAEGARPVGVYLLTPESAYGVGRVVTSVVVIGGGVIGMAVAWRLAGDGHEVTVLDPNAGHGATWAAAGMLAPISEASFGEDALLTLSLAALRRWPSFELELEACGHGDLGMRRDGTLNVALDHDDKVALDRLTAFRTSLGLPVESLTGSQARRLEPFLSPSVRSGVLANSDLSVDNRRYWRMLHSAALARGVRVIAQRVAQVLVGGGRVKGALAEGGAVIAGTVVVIAAGSGSGLVAGLDDLLPLPIRPVKGQILRLNTSPLGRASPGLLTRTVRALVHGHDVYVVPRTDGEVVVGATVEEKGHDLTVTAGAVYDLLRDACDVLPVLSELEFVEATAGLRPGTPDNGPLVGRTSVDGLIMATGHYRNGILLSPITADAIGDLVAGDDPDPYWLPFAADRFVGGPR